MRTASVIINLLIFSTTAALVVQCFRREGRWDPARGRAAFRYFTVLSNALCALAALAMAVCQIRGRVSPAVLMFKYLGTASLSVTLATVLAFLGPTMGYRELLSGGNLYLHLLGPLLAIASFCFLEKDDMAFSSALAGLIPVALYGALYLYRVVFAPEGRRWDDFYGFNRGGRWPLAFAAMLAGTFGLCLLLWAL